MFPLSLFKQRMKNSLGYKLFFSVHTKAIQMAKDVHLHTADILNCQNQHVPFQSNAMHLSHCLIQDMNMWPKSFCQHL
jgi:hypothetical protein